LGGASGSPVVDTKKQVVGVFAEALQLNFSRKRSYVANLEYLQDFVKNGLRNEPNNNLGQALSITIRSLKDLAHRRVVWAQYTLGVMYYAGKGIPQNYEKALYWYEQAAARGLAEAQFFLGRMYNDNTGVPQNYEKAFYWHERAAIQGFAESQVLLGHMYYTGNGVPRNYQKAFEWFEKAAIQGDSGAQLLLGFMYYEGQVVPQNYEIASKWFEKAAMESTEIQKFLDKHIK